MGGRVVELRLGLHNLCLIFKNYVTKIQLLNITVLQKLSKGKSWID